MIREQMKIIKIDEKKTRQLLNVSYENILFTKKNYINYLDENKKNTLNN